MKASRTPLGRRQRGIASLLIVAVLFFVVSLVAAYMNRNLIFEQRTSVNQYRSTLAFEAAEAGLEWALAMLNGGRIDESCVASADETQTSFRERYLAIAESTGRVTPTGALTGSGESTVWPSCVFNEGAWSCSCPAPGDALDLDLPSDGGSPHPAFRIRFVRLSNTPTGAPPPPGAIRIEVNGCTRLADECLNFPATGVGGEGRATVRVLIALRGGLAAPPVAALTVREDLTVGGALGVFNPTTAAGGIAVITGGTIDDPSSLLQVGGAPGAPSDSAKVTEDTGLASLTAVRLFVSSFAIWPDLWRDQPAVRRLDCTSGCDGDDVRDAIALYPGHVVWVDGDIALDGGAPIGSATQPVLLVVDGDLTSIDAGTTFHGLIHVRTASWEPTGSGSVRGAVVAENAMGGSPAFDVVFDADVLQRLRWQTGSFVRVPGGWRDF